VPRLQACDLRAVCHARLAARVSLNTDSRISRHLRRATFAALTQIAEQFTVVKTRSSIRKVGGVARIQHSHGYPSYSSVIKRVGVEIPIGNYSDFSIRYNRNLGNN